MEMIDYIEKGQELAGSQAKLSKHLGISDRYIRLVREGKRCLAADVCIKLADYIKADRLEVIAASNLVTEKDEAKRKIFESCFRRVAGVAVITAVSTLLTFAPASSTHATLIKTFDNNKDYKQ